MRKSALLLAVAMLAVFAVSAFPQMVNDEMRVNVPYSFTVQGMQFPAGRYIIQRTGVTLPLLIIRAEDKTKSAEIEVLTRIDGRRESEDSARIVLDKFEGDRYALSEVYFPGEDGYLIAGAKNTPHKHESIKAAQKSANN